MREVLPYLAGAILIAWGAAHLAPTRAVVASFGPLSVDNRRILVMEWVAEGVSHVFLGALAIAVALAGGSDVVFRSEAVALVVLAGLTAATGSRTAVIWFRLCPGVLTAAAALLVAATLV